jgi:hypothetical protein
VPLLEELGQRLGPFRCAILTTRDASFGMARMAAILAEATPAEVRPFRALDQAEAWLLEGASAA